MSDGSIALEASVVWQLHVAEPIAHDFLILVYIERMAFLQLVYVDGMVVGGTLA